MEERTKNDKDYATGIIEANFNQDVQNYKKNWTRKEKEEKRWNEAGELDQRLSIL